MAILTTQWNFEKSLVFWQSHPALWYGLLTLLTTLFFFHPHLLFVIPLITLFTPFLLHGNYLKVTSGGILIFSLFLWLKSSILLPPENFEPLHGQAILSIMTVQQANSSFGKYTQIRGTLVKFTAEEGGTHVKNIPVSIAASKEQNEQLIPGYSYLCRGLLSRKPNGYRFKCESGTPTLYVQPLIPLAKWRQVAKEAVRHRILDAVSDTRSANFIAGLATGEFDDRMTKHQLSRFGLQHLLAISGFHFALLSCFLGFLLALLVKNTRRDYFLLGLLALYTLYLGNSPSVIRAWLMLSLAIAAPLLGRQAPALNSLGIALLLLILVDPHAVNNLGFQFSCAITASILIFNHPIKQLLENIYPKRKLEHALSLNRTEQHGLILLSHFRQLLALTLSVNLIALPLCLAAFHKFPWMSLPYNLFFPLLTAPVLFFLLIGILLDTFSFFLGGIFHSINSTYTSFLLNLTYNMPETIDSVWVTSALTPEWLGLLFLILFSCGIYFRTRSDVNKDTRSPYLYLG